MRPYREVNGLPAESVAEAAGLKAARERRKYGCVGCESSDALHAFEEGFYCFSCGRRFSNVDAAALAWGLTPAEACERLASIFGIVHEYVPSRPPMVRRTMEQPPRTTTGRDANLRALHALDCPLLPPVLYGDLLDRTDLTARGATYCDARGFDSEMAYADGFRSIDGARQWDQLRAHFATQYRMEEVRAAGLHWLPFSGRAAALVIPYRFHGSVIGLRFRAIGDWPQRYYTLKDADPPLPYNADAIDGADELHVVEGELNAYTLHLHGLKAIGVAGAEIWQEAWTARLRDVQRLVAWYDMDAAGDRGAAKLAARLAHVLGSQWVSERARRVILPAGQDANDLHREGLLHERVARASWR